MKAMPLVIFSGLNFFTYFMVIKLEEAIRIFSFSFIHTASSLCHPVIYTAGLWLMYKERPNRKYNAYRVFL